MKKFIASGILITTLFAFAGYNGYSLFGNTVGAGKWARGHSSYHK